VVIRRKKDTADTGKAERDRQDRKGRTGTGTDRTLQEELDRQNRTVEVA
jgi:hypothetical protein